MNEQLAETWESYDPLTRAALLHDGYEAFDAWRSNPTFKFPKQYLPVLRIEERAEIFSAEESGIHPASLFTDADAFIRKTLPPRKPLLTDIRTGGVVLYESSINQIFAYRGIGKSVVVNALMRPLLTGKDWLHFRANQRAEVVLVDGELPLIQLQERLREFTGSNYDGRLRILSPELLPAGNGFPILSKPEDQERFIGQIGASPKVIVFDTLSSIFKFDTNDADQWTVVNDFLRRLRFAGHCVILVHHAGKNNTQRGRTDGDDHLDVSIQLHPRANWQPGNGLQFEWKYEKVRHGAYLPGFEAAYDKGWAVVEDDRAAEVMALAKDGKTQREIAKETGLSQATVNRIKLKAEGLARLNGERKG